MDHVSNTQYDEKVPVLIVGGSLIGLCMSLFLSRQGIKSLVVERHPGTAIHPRVASLTARTMEIFRANGAESEIRRVEPLFSLGSKVLLSESLVAEPIDNLMEDFSAYFTEASPEQGSLIAQDVLETVLPTLALEVGGDLRYHTELIDFEQDEEGITAIIRDLRSETTSRVRAEYMIAADGSRSGIRRQLGIGYHGADVLGSFISVLFEAPGLMDLFRERQAVMCFFANEAGTGAITSYPGSVVRPDVFRVDVTYDPDEETIADFTMERCLSIIGAAIGIPDFPVTIKTILPWEMVARVSDGFQKGRVFLVGDAARAQPPAGGLGGNTGIAEAQNLAWKLATVLREEANEQLLATYDVERRPVADFTVEQVQLLSQQRQTEGSEGIAVDTLTINMGYRYTKGAILQEDDENLPFVQRPELWTGQPGTRAPHIVINNRENQISTLDLFGTHFVLLAGPDGQKWTDAAQRTCDELHLPMNTYRIDRADGRKFCDAYGVTATGAVIVRPDGFIGWRSKDSLKDAQETEHALTQAMTKILCH